MNLFARVVQPLWESEPLPDRPLPPLPPSHARQHDPSEDGLRPSESYFARSSGKDRSVFKLFAGKDFR